MTEKTAISANAQSQLAAAKKVVLSKQKITGLRPYVHTVKVAWKKNTKASGYQIKICSKRNFKGRKLVTVRSKNTLTKKISGLAANKKYYVTVRSYKKSGGKTYYGSWSTVKSVKTRKAPVVAERPDHYIQDDVKYYKYTVNVSGLRLRQSPRTNSRILGTLPKGATIYEYGYNDSEWVNGKTYSKYDTNQWIYTKYNGKFCWVTYAHDTGKTNEYGNTEYEYYLTGYGGKAKPVIYLYPTKKTDVSVKVKLTNKNETLGTTYPKYNNGWNCTAYPDGKIINKADGEEYDYLFWDSKNDTTKYDTSKGFVVKGKDSEKFLRKALKKLGLNNKERNEFIVYWLPKLEENKYNFISFQTKAYTDSAKLEITPKPDSVLRVFMTYKPLDKKISVPKQELTGFTRKGFTVVEWGGEEIR